MTDPAGMQADDNLLQGVTTGSGEDAVQQRRLLQTSASSGVLCNAKCQSQVTNHIDRFQPLLSSTLAWLINLLALELTAGVCRAGEAVRGLHSGGAAVVVPVHRADLHACLGRARPL